MDTDIVVGCVVIGAALAFAAFLVAWSRRAIDRIAESGGRSAREIEKDLNGGG